MASKIAALYLTNDFNDYQKITRADAVSAAEKGGIDLRVYTAENRAILQVKQLQEILQGDEPKRPHAVIVVPVRAASVSRIASEVVRAGIGWISINRRVEGLDDLREKYPHLPIGFVSPDQREIGKIQGRQFRALLPNGGHLLYIQGDATTQPAALRLEGMREAISGSGIELAGTLDGNWTEADAERVVGNFLRIVMAGTSRLDLVGCQNDAMALGALSALKSVAQYLKRPQIAEVPLTGCDGVPTFGQELVKQGKLAATVIVPSTGGPAVELLAAAWNRGQRPPAETWLSPKSFPEVSALRPINLPAK
jgi:ABC-type sugar transport system substrate-binding protein